MVRKSIVKTGSCLGKEHLKYKGLSENTKFRYKRACIRFLEWRKLACLSKPRRLSTLEYQCGEFIHFYIKTTGPCIGPVFFVQV